MAEENIYIGIGAIITIVTVLGMTILAKIGEMKFTKRLERERVRAARKENEE